MGSGDSKSKVKPQIQNEQQSNQNKLKSSLDESQNNSKGQSQQQSAMFKLPPLKQSEQQNKKDENQKKVIEVNTRQNIIMTENEQNQGSKIIVDISENMLSKRGQYREQLNTLNIRNINNQNGSAKLENKFNSENITQRVRKISQIKINNNNNLGDDNKGLAFKQVMSVKSYNSVDDINTNINNNSKLKIDKHIGNIMMNSGSNIFKSTRQFRSSQFAEDRLPQQKNKQQQKKKIMIKSMRNMTVKNIKIIKDNSSDTSSYQSSVYNKDNSKNNRPSDESPQLKTSPVNTPISLKKLKPISKGVVSPFRRDQFKKYSEKTVKELLEQNIFKYQSNIENLDILNTEEQDNMSITQQNNQKIQQDNWLQGSISKISSVANSEQMIRSSHYQFTSSSAQINKGSNNNNNNNNNKIMESQELLSANAMDAGQTTQATTKANIHSNDIGSSNLRTKQELDHPHTSQSTFKIAHIQKDLIKKSQNQSITSLKDIMNSQNMRKSRIDLNQGDGQEEFKYEKKVRKISMNQLGNSMKLVGQGQGSLLEKENEEGSIELQNQILGNEEDDDDMFLEEDDQFYYNMHKIKQPSKQEDEQDEEEDQEDEEMQELNDSLLTSYDIGNIDALHIQKSQPQEDEDLSDAFGGGQNRRKKRNKFYLGTDIYQKIKRVYIRSTLENRNPVQYFQQKTFKFEWVTGEIEKKKYFFNQLKQRDLKQKNSSPSASSSRSSSSSPSPSQQKKGGTGVKRFRDVGGTFMDQDLNLNNPLRNAVSDIEDSQLFINKKHYSKDRIHLKKFFVAVCSRKGNREDDLPIQDDYLFYRDYLTTIYAVLDGHGPYGHVISNIAYRLILTKFLSSINCYVSPELALRSLFRNISKDIDKIIKAEGMRRFNTLIVSNVGDTKAFIFKKNVNLNKKDKILAFQLTDDHIPSNIEERKRIYNCYGEVRMCQDFCEKVFVRGRDYPGIHLTRSIGDLIASEIGVISDPCIRTYDIDQNDNFLLIGTSSLFEQLPIEEIWSIISPFECKNVLEASQYLQTRLKQVQKQQLQPSFDTTFVLSFL